MLFISPKVGDVFILHCTVNHFSFWSKLGEGSNLSYSSHSHINHRRFYSFFPIRLPSLIYRKCCGQPFEFKCLTLCWTSSRWRYSITCCCIRVIAMEWWNKTKFLNESNTHSPKNMSAVRRDGKPGAEIWCVEVLQFVRYQRELYLEWAKLRKKFHSIKKGGKLWGPKETPNCKKKRPF